VRHTKLREAVLVLHHELDVNSHATVLDAAYRLPADA